MFTLRSTLSVVFDARADCNKWYGYNNIAWRYKNTSLYFVE
jgi:hypothetical protein